MTYTILAPQGPRLVPHTPPGPKISQTFLANLITAQHWKDCGLTFNLEPLLTFNL